jgi:ribosomal protein S21
MATMVRKQPGQTEDQLIAQFRKKVFNEDLLSEISKKDFYQKPSRIRYEKERAQKRQRRVRTR